MLLGKLDKRNPTFAAVRILQFCLILALLKSGDGVASKLLL